MDKTIDRSVSSTEFQNRAGLYLDRSGAAPVFITKYRRPARVLMDFEEYNRLQALAKARPTRQAYRAGELPADVVQALESADFSHLDPELDKLME